ncbi:MAG: membrane protein insertase YidC [Chromatiales bacterium]|nr:membrane protein insertase YidC [Chromatiales bacterium]
MLFIGLAIVLFLMYQEWQKDYGPQPTPATEQIASERSRDTPTGAPPTARDKPPTDRPTSARATAQAGETDVKIVSPTSGLGSDGPALNLVTAATDVIRIYIDTRGGTLRKLDLLKHPVSLEEDAEPFRLLNDTLPNIFMAQSGLIGKDAPDHTAEFSAASNSYELEYDADTLEVPLTWRSESGLEVRKIIVLKRDSYELEVRYEVTNLTNESWSGEMYGQLKRTQVTEEGGNTFIYTYMGGVVSSEEEPYEKIDFSDMADENLKRTVKGGWAAMIQHYFVGAWIPPENTKNHYYTLSLGNAEYVIGVVGTVVNVPVRQTGTLSMRAYVGPKDQARMTAAALGLERTVDYGFLFVIAQPLFWALTFLHSFLGNWGWAIIVLTFSIKLAFFQLSAKSYKSMARMRKLHPKLMSLRERYGDDRQKLNQSMMELYKTEKINPLGGCWPVLVQIPVFISLYWVLLESVELRHAPFMFWLTDLSSHDRFFVLPVIMGLSMLVQQRLNPTPPDPMQAKIMMALPFVFTIFFLWFPSGLVLYWVVNNCLSIIQQYVITKRIEAE